MHDIASMLSVSDIGQKMANTSISADIINNWLLLPWLNAQLGSEYTNSGQVIKRFGHGR